MSLLLYSVRVYFFVIIVLKFQGKGMQKTFWLDGRKGLSLPLLSSQVGESGNEPAQWAQNTDDD